MTLTGIYDAIFVNQLLGTNESGETIFYPNGITGRGYRVPPEREASVRSALRRLSFFGIFGTVALLIFVPRLIEARLGFVMPLWWFTGGALFVGVAAVVLIIRALSRLTEGLAPVAPRA